MMSNGATPRSREGEVGTAPPSRLATRQDPLLAAPDVSRGAVLQEIADLTGVSLEWAAEILDALASRPALASEPLFRRIAEACLAGHREEPSGNHSQGTTGPITRGE